MTTRLSLKIGQWVISLGLILLGLVLVRGVLAVGPEDAAKKYGVTFPIAELGNCADYSSCREYCEDPTHQESCLAFAKKKGFYNEVKFSERKADFWASCKAALGCDSEASCRTICEKPENFEKCASFGQKYQLGGGYTGDPSKAEILQKAKSTLGCDSYSSCKSFCEQEVNRDKCSRFAHEVGFQGGTELHGPGGCTSEETCRAFCSDPKNFQVCQSFSFSQGGKFSGPGGCDSESSCKAYCQSHLAECGNFSTNTGGTQNTSNYRPDEWCNRTPGCSWASTYCKCASAGGVSPEDYCQKYPEQCNQNLGSPEKECTKYPGCSWTGSTCQCSGTSTPLPSGSTYPDPAKECVNHGCTWTNSACQCPPSPTTSATPSCSGGTYWNGTSCVSSPTSTTCSQPSGGCGSDKYWDSGSCSCKSNSSGTSGSTPPPSSPDPATECAKTSGCSWTGTTCQCSSVHGASTVNWLEAVLQFVHGIFR